MERQMHELGDFYIRLDHVTLVSPLLGNRGGFGFSVVFVGNHTHTFAYSSNDEAKAAHDALLQALQALD
jgi:hypothetical protein